MAAGEAILLQRPGTMDACYSYANGKMIAHGQGWEEPFVWNYLDDPTSLPHPAFLYWMPLPSILAALGMLIGGEGFRQAQLGFWLLAAGFPAFVYWLAVRWKATIWTSLAAGLFAMFPGFYAVYAGTTDSFYLFAWMGGGIFALIRAEDGYPPRRLFVLGLLCGLAHLTRADGVLFIGLIAVWWVGRQHVTNQQRILGLLILLSGYGIVCAPWYLRNWIALGNPMVPAAGRAAWIQNYDQLFHFPASDLMPRWLFANGILPVIAGRWESFLWNLQTTCFVLGLVFFAPFMVLGGIQKWRNLVLRMGTIYFSILFLLMTLIFPFQGARGGLFHSSAAVLSLACVGAAAGLEACIRWVATKRNWNLSEAFPILFGGFVLIAIVSTVTIFATRVGGSVQAGMGGDKTVVYRQIAATVSKENEQAGPVMVGDPPCFFAETNMPSVVIPEGGVAALISVADQFHVRYFLLDQDIPAALIPVFQGTEINPRFLLLANYSDGVTDHRYLLFQVVPAMVPYDH
jgi:hypothetical protein